jgi:hypothetical protein
MIRTGSLETARGQRLNLQNNVVPREFLLLQVERVQHVQAGFINHLALYYIIHGPILATDKPGKATTIAN